MAAIKYVPMVQKRTLRHAGTKVTLTDKELDRFNAANRAAAHSLRGIIGTPGFAALPDTIDEGGKHSKEQILKRAFGVHRSAARKRIIATKSFQARLAEAKAQ